MSISTKKTTGVVRNPLTVIAIFAGLAEVTATIALPQIDKELQYIFVWFVMFFPVLLVCLFFYVLWHKNQVLYAPSDFSDESNFMSYWQHSPPDTSGDDDSDFEDGSKTTDEADAKSSGKSTSLEKDVKRVLSNKARRRMSEQFVVDYISKKLSLSLTRDVRLSGKKSIRYDAIADSPNGPILVEVRSSARLSSFIPIIREELQRAEALSRELSLSKLKGGRVIVCIVYRGAKKKGEFETMISRIKKMRDDYESPIPVELEFFSLEEIERELVQ